MPAVKSTGNVRARGKDASVNKTPAGNRTPQTQSDPSSKRPNSDAKGRNKKEDAKREEKEDEVEEEEERGVKTGHRVGVCGKSGNADDSDLCVVCSRAVTMSQHGLQCDGCEYWHHANCDKVDDDVYSFLCSHNKDPSLLWYCRKCVATHKNMSKMMMAMQDHQQQIEERMNDLANVVNRKMDDIVNELNKKFDETGQKITEVETQRQSLEA